MTKSDRKNGKKQKRRIEMKRNGFAKLMVAASIGLLSACSQDPASINLDSDEEAIQYLVEENEDYFTLAGIDDDGAQPMEYDSDEFGKTSATIDPLRFGRKGRFQLESITVDRRDDGTALATIVRSYDGKFYVLASDSTDSIAAGKLYTKDMENDIVHRAIFKKVDDSRDRRRNWRLRRVSGSQATSPGTTLSFEYVTVKTSNGREWTMTDPLEFITDLDSIPHLNHRDSVTVSVKINNLSSYTDRHGETVMLRYKNDRGLHRARKGLHDDGIFPDRIANDGIYSGYWIVGQRPGIYHALVDAIDNGTIYDDRMPYNSTVWGFPYIVR